MKQYDKNSLIGFFLMAIILIVFNTFFFPEVPKQAAKKNIETPLDDPQFTKNIATTSSKTKIDDTTSNLELKKIYGVFANTAVGKESFHILENNKLKITVSNKGGRIVSVIMKEYQTFDSLPLNLFDPIFCPYVILLFFKLSINVFVTILITPPTASGPYIDELPPLIISI